MKKFATKEMIEQKIPAMTMEEIDVLTQSCAAADPDYCERCPVHPIPDCGAAVLELLRVTAQALIEEQTALLNAVAEGMPVCPLCAHSERYELKLCDVDGSMERLCGEGDVRCGSCTCADCRNYDGFELAE